MKRNSLLTIDWWILIPAVVLTLFGLITMFSINPAFFRNQLFSFTVALVFFFFFSQFSVKGFRIYGTTMYISSIIVLLIVLFIGFESRGATRWIEIFGVSVQFSEVFKPLLLITFADYMARREKISLHNFLITFLFALPVAFLVYKQPDLGNGLIYLGVVSMSLLFVGFPFWWFGIGLVGILATSPIWWKLLHEYQRQRVLALINPTIDPTGISYNVIQAMIAVGSGGFLGKGLTEGTQSSLRFLPENHTDFIFASLSERLGFIGAGVVIVTFGFLLYRIFIMFVNASDTFERIFLAGAFSLLFIHFFVNVGMNLGIMPVVGVTLPFVSFGGSSLVTNFMLLGMVSSFSHNTRRREVLEIR